MNKSKYWEIEDDCKDRVVECDFMGCEEYCVEEYY